MRKLEKGFINEISYYFLIISLAVSVTRLNPQLMAERWPIQDKAVLWGCIACITQPAVAAFAGREGAAKRKVVVEVTTQ